MPWWLICFPGNYLNWTISEVRMCSESQGLLSTALHLQFPCTEIMTNSKLTLNFNCVSKKKIVFPVRYESSRMHSWRLPSRTASWKTHTTHWPLLRAVIPAAAAAAGSHDRERERKLTLTQEGKENVFFIAGLCKTIRLHQTVNVWLNKTTVKVMWINLHVMKSEPWAQ